MLFCLMPSKLFVFLFRLVAGAGCGIRLFLFLIIAFASTLYIICNLILRLNGCLLLHLMKYITSYLHITHRHKHAKQTCHLSSIIRVKDNEALIV